MRGKFDPRSMDERFADRFSHTTSGCWEWQGPFDGRGYGVIYDDQHPRRPQRAHRVGYALYKGAIPENSDIDHLCRNIHCVNPDHLEAVSHKENVRRGQAPNLQRHRAAVCLRGHPMNDQNSYLRKNGTRQCRLCHRLEMREKYHALHPLAPMREHLHKPMP